MSAAVTLIDVGHVSKQQAASAQVASSPTNSNEYSAQQRRSSLAPSPSSASFGADLLKSGGPSIVALPDPSTGDARDYLVIPAITASKISAENTNTATTGARAVDIYEVQGCTGPSKYGSYFVGSRVVSDGTLRVATRVDPLFFVLAAIEAKMKLAADKNTGASDPKSKTGPRWQPLDQLLADVAPTVRDALRNASTNAALSPDEVIDKQMRNLFHMTDQYGDDMILYKFDEKIALSWLKAKHARALAAAKAGILRASLRDEVQKSESAKLGGGGGAFSSAFNMGDDEEEEKKEEEEATAVAVTQSPSCSQGTATLSPASSAGDVVMLSKEDEAKARAAALQLVCEYLSDGWRNKLLKELPAMTEEDLLGPTPKGKKRKAAPAAGEDDDDHIDLDAEEDMTKPPSKWDSGNDAVDKLQQIARGVDGCGGAAGSTNAIMMDEEEREKAKKKEENMNAKSMGLKKLAKVNTKGMKSLSSFFGGGAKKKKKVQ